MFCLCLVASFTTLAPCTLIVASLPSSHCFATSLLRLLLCCFGRFRLYYFATSIVSLPPHYLACCITTLLTTFLAHYIVAYLRILLLSRFTTCFIYLLMGPALLFCSFATSCLIVSLPCALCLNKYFRPFLFLQMEKLRTLSIEL